MKLLLLLVLFVSAAWTRSVKNKVQPHEENSGRIIGGENARAGQFPFAAAFYANTAFGRYFCGGALISNEWILTAGHCVDGVIEFTIYLGSNTLTTSDANRQIVTANSSSLHPDYNNLTLQNDIGLIRLSDPVWLSDYISTIFLPSTDLQSEADVVAIGWGQTDDFHPGPVDHLNHVDVITLPVEECQQTYGDQIFDTMVCVEGVFNQGTCTGDSGTPLVRYILNERHAEVVGISSFLSDNGCESIDPSGYTKVYSFLDWIKTVTDLP